MKTETFPRGYAIVRGRHAVLDWAERLSSLGQACGQPGAGEDLAYQFTRPAFASKTPTLVVTSRSGSADISGAALVYEHRLLGVGTGVFSADFHGGNRAVIGPPADRAQIAFKAATALLQAGGLATMLSYESDEPAGDLSWASRPGQRWAARPREMYGYLRIETTLDATLAHLGKHTRRNFRHYRRLAESQLGTTLVESPSITLEQFCELNRSCDYAVPDATAAARYHSLGRDPRNRVFFGLRTAAGEWLSLIGGRTQGPVTLIEWQMNRTGRPELSICTLMRSYLLAHEVQRGARRLGFVGGTQHNTRTGMVPERVTDLVIARPSVPAALLKRIARVEAGYSDYFGEIDHLVRSRNCLDTRELRVA